MNKKEVILGSAVFILAITAYFYFKSKKNKTLPLTSNIKSGQLNDSDITNVSANTVMNDTPTNATIGQIVVNQIAVDEKQKYLQSLEIQTRVLSNANIMAKYCPPKIAQSWNPQTAYDLCFNASRIAIANEISNSINPLGYKLEDASLPKGNIVKITV